MKSAAANDIPRITLLTLIIGLLVVGSFWTLLPFLSGLIWATTIALATWPLLLRLERLLWGRRSLAVAAMTLVVSLAFIVPFVLTVVAVIQMADRGPALIQDFFSHEIGPPPEWMTKIPLVGNQLADQWQSIAAGGPTALADTVRPYARSAATWLLAATGGFGKSIVLTVLTAALVAILYARGEVAAQGVFAFAYRLGGATGERTMKLIGQAIRSVALGVVVTALVQSLLAGLGLWICGVPHAVLLTAIAFAAGIAQLGPSPILIPSIIWLYWTGSAGWATVLVAWTLPVTALDNVMRPILIRRGVQLPMLLIIAGVIGGLIGFGIVGLFVGPVILAATYTLAKDWVARDRSDNA